MGTDLIRKKLEAEVVEAIARACKSPMRWGVDDCGLWIAEPIRRVLGYDIAASYRGRYRSQRGAHRVLGKHGLAAAARTQARLRHWKVIDAQDAQAGDVGLVDTIFEGRRVLACVICRTGGWFVARGERGVTAIPARMVRMAWKVAPHVRPALVYEGPRVPLIKPPTRPVMIPTSGAAHEPVSTLIGLSALIFNVGTAIGIPLTVGAAAAIGGAVVGIGISIGLSYAASALTQRGGQPISDAPTSGLANDPSIRYNTRQPIPPKRIIYGTAQVGGALFFEETRNPFLYQGVLICDKAITRFNKMWLGNAELPFAGILPGFILSPLPGDGQPDYPGNVQLSVRLGSRDQAIDPIIGRDFPSLGGTQIPQGTGTTISGNMSSPAASFDGLELQNLTSGSNMTGGILNGGADTNTQGFVGKNFGGSPVQVLAGAMTASQDHGIFTGNFNSIRWYRVRLWASNSAPASYNNGTQLGDSGQIDGNAHDKETILVNSSDQVTLYQYVWMSLEIRAFNDTATDGNWTAGFVELKFFATPATPASFRQQGIATAVVRYDYGANADEYTKLWGQVQRPNPIFLVDGIAVPDPRDPSQIVDFNPDDPDEVAAAEATWKFSNNAALCQAHYLIQKYGGGIRPDRIDWDKVKSAADWDDGPLETKEGETLKRGTIDGVITLNQRPADVMSSMISANRGFILESGGKVWVSSSRPRPTVATITDRLISGAIDYRAAKPKKDLLNKIKVRFVAADRDYQTADGPVLERDDLITNDGELLEGVLDLPFTLDHRRAQMLQKAFLENARLGRRISVTCDIELLATAADELVGNCVSFSSDTFAQFNGTYFVETWGFADNFGSIQLDLAEYDPSIETDWDAATDQQDFELVVTDP